LKKAVFHPAARTAIQSFPREARKEIGEAITDLQLGMQPTMPVFRTMASVGPGVGEIRISERAGAFRVFYYLKLKDAVLIFHAFQKKTEQTPKREIDIGLRRLKEMVK
jgi:phage-related protein